MSLVSQFAIAAVHLALGQARLPIGKGTAAQSVAIVYGTSHGPGATTQEIYDDLINHGSAAVKPRAFQESVFNAPASLGQHSVRREGPDPGPGRQRLRSGGASTGADAACAPRCRRGDRALRGRAVRGGPARPAGVAMAPAGHRTRASSPSGSRRGSVSSEGAAALILERAEEAVARGACTLGEMAGAASTNDALEAGRPAQDAAG